MCQKILGMVILQGTKEAQNSAQEIANYTVLFIFFFLEDINHIHKEIFHLYFDKNMGP